MRAWYIPAWCGDFRLTARDEASCLLTVEKPTTRDRERLSPFLLQCAKEGVLREAPVLNAGETLLVLHAPMHDLGPKLAQQTAQGAVWTVVACVNGEIRLADGVGVPDAPEPIDVAATLKPPERGCPAPSPANRRASEVLRAFSTPAQTAAFERQGYMRVIGGSSGRAYNVYHRDEAARRGLSRCVIDVATRNPVCAWDATVPAEEEALSLKLALEHRERWLWQHTMRAEW